MMNGCICCTVRADLAVVLKKLKARHESGAKLDAIIIETTGMADPAPVAQTFFVLSPRGNFAQRRVAATRMFRGDESRRRRD